MKHFAAVLALAAAAVCAQESQPSSRAADVRWPSFRGEFARGVGDGALPTKWNLESGENIAWKTELPGLSHSSPVIWGDRLFVTNAVKEDEAELVVGLYGSIVPVDDDSEHELQVACLDRNNGEILWTRTAWTGVPSVKRHPKGSHAAATPATDGEHVVAFFGSEGLYCYTVEGELLWQVDLGEMDAGFYMMPDAQWGFASSPVIFEDRVYVQCDVQKGSFVAALSLADGSFVWRTERDEVPGWGTPTVHVTDDRRQLIVNGYKHIGSYDLDTGEELWKLEGGGDIPVPTPVVAHDLAFITNAHGKMAPILAIDVAAEGELKIDAANCEAMKWAYKSGGNYMQTPLVLGDLLYCCKDMGVLSCFDAKTGERHYRKRLEGGVGFTASGVGGDDKLYFTSEVGDTYVIRAGLEYEVLSVNEMGETVMASPAIAGGRLYFRTRHHVVAVGG